MPCLTEDLVLALTSGTTTEQERAAAELHLDSCEPCQLLVAAAARDFASGVPPAPGAGAMLLPGALIANRYRVERFVAQGGMGEVYEAFDQVLDERIALKTSRPIAADNPKAALRLKAEVQLARRVSHPHTCRIYDFSEWVTPEGEALQFLTMEFIQGTTLGNQLRREGRRAPEEVLVLAEQLLSGLDAVHRLGIVHRDFKSDNVMLHDSSPLGLGLHAVITDFGLARGLDERRARLTSNSRALVGSAAYMAPEQVLGEELTPAADVYAFGVVLFELLTGSLPFTGDSPIALAVRRLNQPAPRPSALVPDLPAYWDALVAACLARSVESRLPDAGAVLRRLLEFRSGSVAALSTAAHPAPSRRARDGALAGLALLLASWGGVRACQRREPLQQQVAAQLAARPSPPRLPPIELSPAPSPAPAHDSAPHDSALRASAPAAAPARPRAPAQRSAPALPAADVPRPQPEPAPPPGTPEPVPARPSADPRDGFKW
jgi:serine/threonine protein kinase